MIKNVNGDEINDSLFIELSNTKLNTICTKLKRKATNEVIRLISEYGMIWYHYGALLQSGMGWVDVSERVPVESDSSKMVTIGPVEDITYKRCIKVLLKYCSNNKILMNTAYYCEVLGGFILCDITGNSDYVKVCENPISWHVLPEG